MLNEKRIRQMFDDLESNGLSDSFDFSILKELDRVMKKRNIYIWCNKLLVPKLFGYYLDDKTMFDIICWHKTNAMPLCGSKYLTDTEYCLYFHETMSLNTTYDTAKTHYEQPINMSDKKRFGHPTIKPLNIIQNFVLNSSNPNEIVLDCFSGSGTTAIACKDTGRNFLCFEIEQKWVDIANNRLRGITGAGQVSFLLR